jgi:hypothetical protein
VGGRLGAGVASRFGAGMVAQLGEPVVHLEHAGVISTVLDLHV